MRSTSLVVLCLIAIAVAVAPTRGTPASDEPPAAGSRSPAHGRDHSPGPRDEPCLRAAKRAAAIEGHAALDKATPTEAPEDPWLPGFANRPVAGKAVGREVDTPLELTMLTIGPDGGADFSRGRLTPELRRGVVVYDLRGLLAAEVGNGVPLRGHEQDHGVGDGTWCHAYGVLLDIARALASSNLQANWQANWQANGGLLAWSKTQEYLYVGVPEVALPTVEALLDDWSTRQASVVPVRVRYAEGDGAFESEALTVDVPWGVPVRAWRGSSWTYLQDFDVEVGNGGAFISEPIWGDVETGYGLAAKRVPTQAHPEGELALQVLRTVGRPRFEAYRTSLASDFPAITIEIPHTGLVQWGTQLPGTRLPVSEPRSWVVPFGDEGRLRIEVGEVTYPSGTPQRAWRRLEGVPPTDAKGAGWDLELSLHGSRSGPLGRDTLSLSGTVARTHALLRTGSPDWLELQRRTKEEAGDGSYVHDAPIAGRVLVDVAAVDRRDRPTRMDLTISAAAWTGQSRPVQIQVGSLAPHLDGRGVDVPSSRTVCVSRRLGLSPRGEGALTFRGDLGRGWEDLTLSVWRSADR